MEKVDVSFDSKYLIKKRQREQNFLNEYSFFHFWRDILGFLISRVVVFDFISPFGLSYYVASASNKNQAYTLIAFIILGIFSKMGMEGIGYIFAVLFSAVFLNMNKKENKNNSFVYKIFISSLGLIFLMIYKIVYESFIIQDFVLSLLEIALCSSMIYIFSQASSLYEGKVKRTKLSNQEIVGVCILFGLGITGFMDIQIYSMSIKYVLCIFIIMSVSYKAGSPIGAAIGTVIGGILAFGNTTTPFVIAIFATAGLIGGFFKEFGKIGSSLGFFMGVFILSFYLDKSLDSILFGKETIVAAGLLFCVPNLFFDKIMHCFNYSEPVERESYRKKIKKTVNQKLDHFSIAFSKLGTTFSSLAETKTKLSKEDISHLFNDVAERICTSCGMCDQCWEKDFYQTYQAMFAMLTTAEKKGKIQLQDIPQEFINQCIQLQEFKSILNQMFEIYKLNMIWHNKVAESRQLVAEQLNGVAKVIENLGKDLDLSLQFKEELECNIEIELDKINISPKEVTVLENKQGQYEVSICMENCNGRYYCNKEITQAISKALEKPMVKIDDYCTGNTKAKCVTKFIEQQKFRISTGIARKAKQEDGPSGDNFSLIELKNGHSVLALSDGMGSGFSANIESSATIELLEQFLELGFDKELAVNMINSILVLKSTEDSFSTIDLSIINHYTGRVEFIKVGASTSFIKKERNVEVISSTSLPVGVLSKVDMEVTYAKLEDGDFIIMMTDGVLDACEDIIHKEDWIISLLYQIDSKNPKDIAEVILEKAIEKSKGQIKDDMTVLVGKIWKRTS